MTASTRFSSSAAGPPIEIAAYSFRPLQRDPQFALYPCLRPDAVNAGTARDLGQFLRLAITIAAAVVKMHARDLVHKGVKPLAQGTGGPAPEGIRMREAPC
jgi:hypothetical protein